MSKRVLHVCYMDKFIPAFIELVRDDIDSSNNHFYLIENTPRYSYREGSDTEQQRGKLGFFKLYFRMRQYDQIVLHGLFNKYVVLLLALSPKLLSRCYWVMWGGDLYSYKNKKTTLEKRFIERCRRKVIKNIGHLVTYIPGDVELVRQWYAAKGEYVESFVYPSNLYKPLKLKEEPSRNTKVTVLVGNSASKSNEHFDAFERLAALPGGNAKIICPLSYGNEEYASKVIEEGKRLFGDDFLALTDFLPLEEYLKLLNEVDIAVFAHRRQQAMGNLITLLGLGKKVYMRSDITPWSMFENLGVDVFDVENLSLSTLDDDTARHNRKIIESYFSRERLVQQLKDIL
ncbi:TDP-N-acetylfucosamine:lipid II N-acetylfucosaminyltransferase [Halomonas sp. GXIMD04776]|uniref:TDP-N-acetylfucosamine:lipid II N-acetylfucosaminyltransferase n=1 Tax=Halomonas sp. GXIMD04776 TaxID=3415605 RepID=UPI003CBF6DEE